MAKKKILFITAMNNSGAPISLLQLLKHKPKHMNFDLSVIGMRFDNLELDFKKIIPFVKILTRNPSKNDIINGLERILVFPFLLFYLFKIKPDIVFINSSANTRAIFLSKILKYVLRYKIIIYVHEYEETYRFFKWIRKKSILLGDKLLIVNKDQEEWIRKGNNYKGSIEVIQNGIDFDEVNNLMKEEPEQTFIEFRYKYKYIVANVGNMTKRKGFDFYMEIINKLISRKEIGFIIIGDFMIDKEKKFFMEYLKNRKLEKRVYITGYTNNIFKYLKYVDVVANTSRSETFSRVTLEAMTIGIPVVAFRIKGLKYTLPEDYKYFAIPFNVDEFVDLLLELLNLNREERNKITGVLKKHSQNYSIKRISEDFWNFIFNELNS